MGKFLSAESLQICKQTKKKINIGEGCYYIPGMGYFHPESIIYRDKIKSGGVRMGKATEIISKI